MTIRRAFRPVPPHENPTHMPAPHRNVLVTAFEPFGGSHVNPSEAAAQLLAGWQIPDRRPPNLSFEVLRLPVVGDVAARMVVDAARSSRPHAIVCLGESSLASGITFERVAINLRDYRIPDNAGGMVTDQPVVHGGPTAYFATLPLRPMLEAVHERGIPGTMSMSAGTFLCNEVMYAALHWAATEAPESLAGFIHLPRLPEQVVGRDGPPVPSMDAMTTARGIAAALAVLAGQGAAVA